MLKITSNLLNKIIPILGISFFSQVSYAQEGEFVREEYIPTKPACIYYARSYQGPSSNLRSQDVIDKIAQGTVCTNIIINYNGFTPEAQAAFQFAVDIWANSIESPKPIRINANFSPLGPGVLGQAGPTTYLTSNAPGTVPSTFYPVALWEKLENRDSDSGPFGPDTGQSVDISCSFSSTFNFYFGTDATPPPGQFDFVSVVLHELAHGLGFAGFASSNGTVGSIRQTAVPRPSIYDTFIENGSGAAILSFPDPSSQLQVQLTSGNLFCNGTEATLANGGSLPPTFAPNPFNGGSSYSHWDEASYPAGDINSLMSPQIGPGEANHNPGPITLGFFEDMGWTLCNSLSVEEFTTENVYISPNPFANNLSITFPQSANGNYKLDILDINGRLVISRKVQANSNSIDINDLSNLKPSLYFIKITDTDRGLSIIKKVIKN